MLEEALFHNLNLELLTVSMDYFITRRDTVQNTDFHMLDFVAHFKKLSRTRTQTDPQVRNWTRPVLRADGESAHETSGIHQAEDIDEDRTLPQASIGSSSEAENPANLRNPNPK